MFAKVSRYAQIIITWMSWSITQYSIEENSKKIYEMATLKENS